MAQTAIRTSTAPLTALAAGGLVAVLVGAYGAAHEPTLDEVTLFGFDSMIAMKVYLAATVGVLAVLQLVGALWMYGKLPMAVPGWLGTAHRAGGVVAILLSLPVAYACLWSLGLQVADGASTRVVVHSVVGCVVYGAVTAKVVAVHARKAPGWLLPVAGGLLFASMVVVVWTSAVWFVGENGWP